MRSTVICHVYNEEYMLPFWLEHHARVFDHGIILDYRSTDASAAIVARVCPTWEVRTSRNAMFDAAETDAEVMDVEASLDGVKMALNVTEFLFLPAGMTWKSYFPDGGVAPRCYRLEALAPVSEEANAPTTLAELLGGIRRVARGERMGHRFAHSHATGRYEVGRHASALESEGMPGATLLWLGFYPWNERVLARKLQIRANIPDADVRERFLILGQHTLTREQMEERHAAMVERSVPFAFL